MPERYRRPEEALADLIREGRRGNRDAQRATGTEKAQTMLVAEQAGTDAAEAIAAAATAETLAKGAVTFSPDAPTAADATGKPLGALWTVVTSNAIESYWELTSLGWINRPLSTTVIPQINIGTGTFGVLSGARLAANAIDGMTITGALIRTAATGQRMEFDVGGFKSFAASGVLTSLLSAYDGYFSLSSPSDSKRLVLSPSTLWAYDDATICAALSKFGLQVYPVAGITAQYMHDRAFVERSVTHSTTGAATHTVQMVANTDSSVTVSAGIVTASASVRDATASLSANFDSGGIPRSTLSADKALVNEIASFTNASDPSPPTAPLSIKSANGLLLDTDTGSGTIKLNSGGTGIEINRASGGSLAAMAGTGGNKASVELAGASGGTIRLNAAVVEYSDDTGWLDLAPSTGWTTAPTDGYPKLSIRRRNGVAEVRGAVIRSSWPANTLVAVIPTGLRPAHNIDGVFRHTATSVGAVQIFANGNINLFAAGSAFAVISGVWMLG